jgi:hypothetical protein
VLPPVKIHKAQKTLQLLLVLWPREALDHLHVLGDGGGPCRRDVVAQKINACPPYLAFLHVEH